MHVLYTKYSHYSYGSLVVSLLYIEFHQFYWSVCIARLLAHSSLYIISGRAGSCLVKYGGLLNEQHVLLAVQLSPSQRGSSEWNVVRIDSRGPELCPDSQK